MRAHLSFVAFAVAFVPMAAAVASQSTAAPLAPPDGTYVYVISRDGMDRGTTTLVVRRNVRARALELDEAGTAGAASAHIAAEFNDDDFSPKSYAGTFWSPAFSPERVTRVNAYFDAPFATSVFLLPSARRRSGHLAIAPMSAVLDEGARDPVTAQVVALAPHFATTPKSDVALSLPGLATLWFGRSDGVVHEVHFERINLDARLVSYTRAFAPGHAHAVARTTIAFANAREASFTSDDGVHLSGVVDLPSNGRALVPAIVFVASPGNDRNDGGSGANPMFPDLARTFVARGYAVLRYDTRGTGKSGGRAHTQTRDRSLADVRAALSYARSLDGVDATRVYVLGYGTGADLALAAAASDSNVAGVVALAPAVIAYGDCQRRTSALGDSAFARGSPGYDPRIIAARNRVPLLVLHPGVSVCGETRDETLTYDANLEAHDARTTILAASDVSVRFGNRFDADAPIETEAFFPYRFDPSTAAAIADWLDAPPATLPTIDSGGTPAPGRRAPPSPPLPPSASPT